MTSSPAAQSLLRPQPSKLLPFLVFSVIGHAAVVTLALLFSWLFGDHPGVIDQKPITASLVRLGKPRDEKLLPKKEEDPPPEPAQEKPVEVAAPPKPAEAAIPIPTKDAKVDPKKEAPKDASKPKDAKKDLFAALNKAGKADDVEGRLDGDRNGDSAKQEGERYYGLLSSVVKRNYDVSNSIAEADRRRLRAVVTVRIAPSGELLDVKLSAPSGNELFDAAVVEAVKKAAQFTAPPAHLRDGLRKTGVPFEFTP
jgi:protein TonB